jgi:hypothetical protein
VGRLGPLLLLLVCLLPRGISAQQSWILTQVVSGTLAIPSYRMLTYEQTGRALTRAEQDANWLSALGVFVQISTESGTSDTVSVIDTDGHLQWLAAISDPGETIVFDHASGSIELPGAVDYTLLPGEVVLFAVLGPNRVRMMKVGVGVTAGTGDINSVLNCTGGDCANLVAADGMLIDLSGVNPNLTTEGLRLPLSSNCATAFAAGQLCVQNGILYVGNGTTSNPSGGGGGGSTNSTRQDIFSNGKVVIGANSEANALVTGNGTTRWKQWSASNQAIMKCEDGTNTCHLELRIPAGKELRIVGETSPGVWTQFETWGATGGHLYENARRMSRRMEWTSWTMKGVGAECNSTPTEETVGGSAPDGLRCPMSGTADGYLESTAQARILPVNFDNTLNAEFEVDAFLVQDHAANLTVHGQMMLDCVGAGEVLGTWSTPVGLDMAIVTANSLGARIHGDSQSSVNMVTAGCDPGDWVFVRYQVCANASATPGCSSSGIAEDDLSYASWTMRFWTNN